MTNKAQRLSTVELSKEEKGEGRRERRRNTGLVIGGWFGSRCGGRRLEGDIAMETHRGAGEAVAVGGDDSTFTTCEKLAAIRHPGTAGHLQEGQETEREN